MEFVHEHSNEVFDTYCPGVADDWSRGQREETLGLMRDGEIRHLRTQRHELRVVLTRLYRHLAVEAAGSGCMLITGKQSSVDADTMARETTELKREIARNRRRLCAVEDALESWTSWNVYCGHLPVFLP